MGINIVYLRRVMLTKSLKKKKNTYYNYSVAFVKIKRILKIRVIANLSVIIKSEKISVNKRVQICMFLNLLKN